MLTSVQCKLNLTDIRTLPDFKPTIEENGFCFLENKSKELSKMTGADDCKPYLEEMAQFLYVCTIAVQAKKTLMICRKSRFGTDEIFPINANVSNCSSLDDRSLHQVAISYLLIILANHT